MRILQICPAPADLFARCPDAYGGGEHYPVMCFALTDAGEVRAMIFDKLTDTLMFAGDHPEFERLAQPRSGTPVEDLG